MRDAREWEETIDRLKEEILRGGRFDGQAELWDVIPAICKAIHEINEKVDCLKD